MPRDIVVIGSSAGGIGAIGQLLRDLPADLPAALFIVLHLSPTMNSHLPQIWNRESHMKVIHPSGGERLEHGRVYVAPPDYHLLCDDGRVQVGKGPKENRHRPCIDVLFRSAAENFGSRAIGVVLTGSLDDGTAGLWHIKKRGGIAIVQSPEDALYPSMPLNAMNYVKVDYSVPIKEMGRLITSLCKGERRSRTQESGGLSSGEAES